MLSFADNVLVYPCVKSRDAMMKSAQEQIDRILDWSASYWCSGKSVISDHCNLLDSHAVINLVTSAIDDNTLPSSSHTHSGSKALV